MQSDRNETQEIKDSINRKLDDIQLMIEHPIPMSKESKLEALNFIKCIRDEVNYL